MKTEELIIALDITDLTTEELVEAGKNDFAITEISNAPQKRNLFHCLLTYSPQIARSKEGERKALAFLQELQNKKRQSTALKVAVGH